VQTASAVLCYSRMLFFQCYPTFQRFDCKVFLTDALRYLGGAPERVMIDNTHVVVLRGTGREMVPVPEMAAFAERFGFQFVAHAIGDANRSARVERPFHSSRTTFWPAAPSQLGGSESAGAGVVRQGQLDLQETYPRGAARVVRGRAAASETAAGVDSGSLPAASALVDIEGYVGAEQQPLLGSGGVDRAPRGGARDQGQDRDSTRCPPHWSRTVRASPKPSTSGHAGRAPAAARPGIARPDPHPEEKAIVTAAPEIADYVAGLKQRSRKVVTLALRQLLRLVREYPREPLLAAVREAARMVFTIWTGWNG
jgi:hypothetical protein